MAGRGNAPTFAGMKPPPGYVAGIGRGAAGFTTRSDIGPGAPAPMMGAQARPPLASERTLNPIARARVRPFVRGAPPVPSRPLALSLTPHTPPSRPQATLGDATSGSRSAMARGMARGRGVPAAPGPASGASASPERQAGPFDDFQGGDAGIFAANLEAYDEDDREADAIWDSIDDHMDSRRRDQREARLKTELEKYRRDNPKITEQFADAKRKLAEVSWEEWDAIPDIGDYTIKKKKQGREFAPAPDTLLQKALAEKETDAYLDAAAGNDLSSSGGNDPSSSSKKLSSDLTAVGEGRGAVLGLKLDGMADSVSGQTVVDPKGYLTSLGGVKVSSESDVADIKKARLLLKSVIGTNPKHAPGWIAAARLEELAGKLQAARSFAQRGCDACPTNEDVWLEAARLNPPEDARAVLARAVASLPESTEIWIAAAKLEDEPERKRRVLRKALERVPNSVRLWKAVVDLSDASDAKVLLARATECCPQHVDLWLALARLETHANARVVLNRARETLPQEPQVWIAAAKLEEANGGDVALVDKIIQRALKSLVANGVAIDREHWLREAENAERETPPATKTCGAIVRAVVGLGVEDEDRENTWRADASESAGRGCGVVAREVYAALTAAFPGEADAWLLAARHEKTHFKDASAMDEVLRRAVRHCPRGEVLWLTAAKERWLSGDVRGARDVLEEAFAANPESEDIWLAAFKLEYETRELERARALLAKVRATSGEDRCGPRVWMKSAIVEREAGDEDAERRFLTEGVKYHPRFWKMHAMLGQLERRVGRADASRDAYDRGVKLCPAAASLWIERAEVELEAGRVGKARAGLEQARLRNPKDPRIWLASSRFERNRLGVVSKADGEGEGAEIASAAAQLGDRAKAADAVLAKALLELPDDGSIWAEAIVTAPRPTRKSKSVDALKRCDGDARVIAAVARLFWLDRKVDKARAWFNRAATIDPDAGDVWAAYYAFERKHGGEGEAERVMERCAEADPRHGEVWCATRKTVENWRDDARSTLEKTAQKIDEAWRGG